MLGLDALVPLAVPLPLLGPLAYGPVPGVELIPYFLALLAWVGLALASVFLSPITALIRRLRRDKHTPEADPQKAPMTVSVPESPGGGSHERA